MLRKLGVVIFLIFILLGHVSYAQLSKPFYTHDIRSSAGNELANGDEEPFVTFTIGEPVVQTIIITENIASQGFQQPFLEKLPCNIYFANAFTPRNFDEVNDDFGPVHQCNLEISKFMVFNRWGEKIYESDDPHASWDGRHGNDLVQSGLYPWVMRYKRKGDIKDKERVMRGAVSVIR